MRGGGGWGGNPGICEMGVINPSNLSNRKKKNNAVVRCASSFPNLTIRQLVVL